MKSDTLIIVAVVAVVAVMIYTRRAQLGLSGPSEIDRLHSIIGSLPPDPRFLPKVDKLTKTQGVISGATSGLAFGPIGAGVGAGAGFVASFFL